MSYTYDEYKALLTSFRAARDAAHNGSDGAFERSQRTLNELLNIERLHPEFYDIWFAELTCEERTAEITGCHSTEETG